MTKELQDLVWSILPKEFKEEVRETYKEYAEKIVAKTETGYRIVGYIGAQAELELLFGLHNLTSDAEGEEEILCVSRKQIDALQGEIFKAIMDAHDADDWQDAAHYILDVMPRSFAALFGSKCLPDEVKPTESGRFEPQLHGDNLSPETKPAEPKFKVGELCMRDGYATRVLEYVPTREFPYTIHVLQMNLKTTASESDLEPYAEPKKEDSSLLQAESVKKLRITDEEYRYRNLSQEVSNCDKCPKFVQKTHPDFGHSRLRIAAMAMQGVLSNIDIFNKALQAGEETFTGDDISFRAVAKASFAFADALIAEANLPIN